MDKSEYLLLDSTNAEIKRLELQEAFAKPITDRVLHDAGLRAGMSVQDIGTGAGDVAFMASEIVGTQGRVVGVDQEARMVNHASQRSRGAYANIEFRTGSLKADEQLGKFDFVVARLVTPFQPDPIEFLQRAAAHVSEGGVFALIEPAWNLNKSWSDPPLASYDSLVGDLIQAATSLGLNTFVGSRLTKLFEDAGLPTPSLVAEMWTGGVSSGLMEMNIMNAQILVDRARALGLDACDVGTFENKINDARNACMGAQIQFSGPVIFGAWASL